MAADGQPSVLCRPWWRRSTTPRPTQGRSPSCWNAGRRRLGIIEAVVPEPSGQEVERGVQALVEHLIEEVSTGPEGRTAKTTSKVAPTHDALLIRRIQGLTRTGSGASGRGRVRGAWLFQAVRRGSVVGCGRSERNEAVADHEALVRIFSRLDPDEAANRIVEVLRSRLDRYAHLGGQASVEEIRETARRNVDMLRRRLIDDVTTQGHRA